MKKLLRVLKYTVLAIGVIAGGALTYLYLKRPAMAAVRNFTIEPTAARLARGKYLFNLADCDGCHSQRDFSRFNGPVAGHQVAGSVFPKEMGLPGLVAAPNITPDRETGIGSWTDGEKIRAIREGVDREGRTLFPMMPYSTFRHMSDEDVVSLVAYLNSLPPVNHRVPPTQINFPVSLLIKSAPQPAGHVPDPDPSNRLKYGEYLVQVAGCRGCHTETLSGGQTFRIGPGLMVVSANISQDLTTGIGRWREQDFVDRFTQYREYVEQGSPQAGPESFTLMPWLNFSQLPEDDLRAIYTYLKTVPAVTKPVETHPGFDPVPARLLVSEVKR